MFCKSFWRDLKMSNWKVGSDGGKVGKQENEGGTTVGDEDRK
jgi:hypothetical protein